MIDPYIRSFSQITMDDVLLVGGKNASLGEMIHSLCKHGINVPEGFAITVDAYADFLIFNSLTSKLQDELKKLDTKTLDNLGEVGAACRKLVAESTLTDRLKHEVLDGYQELTKKYDNTISLAVRSSATAEDSPTASFAGQHDSFLNVSGYENLLDAILKCYTSLFNDRAIKYRIDNQFHHIKTALSIGVQVMVRSDEACAGVAFTIEPENGNKNLIYLTGSWGLGESVVQGTVNTDEFYMFKPALANGKNPIVYRQLGNKEKLLIYGQPNTATTQWQRTPIAMRDQFILSDDEVIQLGKWCQLIEDHYTTPMDIEWAKDGRSGKLYIVQARPETVYAHRKNISIKEFKINTAASPILTGKAIGKSIVSGSVCIIKSLSDSAKVKEGDIIVADITNPDWNALLRKAVSIVTNKGGRTSHASIVARELGIPAVVGTLEATEKLHDGQVITVSCAEGDVGAIFDGRLDWIEQEIPLAHMPSTRTNPMFILADPMRALQYAAYPNQGVGLLRMEFMISNSIQIHPMALVKFNELEDPEKKQIEAITRHYESKPRFFIDKLAESVALIATAFFPKAVIVRMSDFKTNEYARLLGGSRFEPEEENPMLGFRGASRYYNDRYREGFGLECAAIRKIRNEMGLTNVKVMIPFCRTVEEGRKVLHTMESFELKRGENGLEVYVMAEIPSNILLAEKFAELFDGFSIGSNDLTQLTLGLDRDSAIVSNLFDEHNDAVTKQIKHLIETAHHKGVHVGLCGQAPSDYPEFASLLVDAGIDSISFNPDAMLKGIENIVAAEKAHASRVS